MRKSILLLTISVLYSNEVFGQFTTHLDTNTVVYVDKEALYYNDGGVIIKDGVFKNKGKVMLKGISGDFFKTLKADNSEITQTDAQQNIGGRFVNILNDPNNFALANNSSEGNNYTYGQLFLSGIDQKNVTGYVQQEHRNVNHGDYQQISIPFYKKELPSLSADFGKLFSNVRWSLNEILAWNNQKAQFDNLNFSQPRVSPTEYYILGNKNNSLDVSSVTKTISGIPYTDSNDMIKILQNAGTVNFGTNGNGINEYREKYNSYLQDGFELHQANGGIAWQGNYGKNLYQFGNPFLMNIDLRNIFVDETSGDGNYLSNIYGIRVEQAAGSISYTPGQGGGANSFRFVTWDHQTNSPVGDVDWLIVRPMSVFVIKLKDNTPQTLNFNTLRRFAYTPRLSETSYSPTTSKGTESKNYLLANTVKQLGVIALDQNNKEIGRTYYVVSPSAQTGHSSDTKYQIASSSTNAIGTYEENPLGGYDYNLTDKYWLYINEAQQDNFLGKPIPSVIYNANVKSLKFELRENSILSHEGTTSLSDGIPFYYRINGQINTISQNAITPVNVIGDSMEFQLYYGSPITLGGGSEVIIKPKTIITFSPAIQHHVVHFSPEWKSANIEIYDMSGRLIITAKNHNTSSDYVIKLNNVDATYFVKAINSTGEVTSTKIINNKKR